MLNRQDKGNRAPKGLLSDTPAATSAGTEDNAGDGRNQGPSEKPVGREKRNEQGAGSENLGQDKITVTPMEDVRQGASAGAEGGKTQEGSKEKASTTTKPTKPAGSDAKDGPPRQSQRIVKQAEAAVAAPASTGKTSSRPSKAMGNKGKGKESNKQRRATKYVCRSESQMKSHFLLQEEKVG